MMDDNSFQRMVDDCIRDLIAPWNSRNRYESAVIGAIELAFRRGYQAGREDKGGFQAATSESL